MSDAPQPPSISTSDFSSAELGKSRALFELKTHEEDTQALIQLFNQAKQRIRIYTPVLNPLLYDLDALVQSVQTFALRSIRSELQILVHDTRTLAQHPHRVLELSHRLSSRIEFKKTHHDFNDRLEEFVLIDDCGLFKRPNAEHYAGLCCFMDPQQVRELGQFFDQAWQHSETDHELRSQLI